MNKKKIVIMLGLSMVLIFGSTIQVSANSTKNINMQRLWGKDRYNTCSSVVSNGWSKSDYAVIASGENFPDALSATPLAKKHNAPIIINKKDTLNEDTIAQLKRLQVKEVIIVGGSGVISDNVENQLKDMGIKVNRLWGNDRYQTSIKVAEELGNDDGVVIASGENFPDALSISAIASQKGMPIILTDKNGKSDIENYFMKNKDIPNTYVIGGEAVVSNNVIKNIKRVTRLSGLNRYETNTKILENFADDVDLTNVYIANGNNFPDALSGSALAPNTKSPIILVDSSVPKPVEEYMKENRGQTSNIKLLGGTAVVSDPTANKIKSLLEGTYVEPKPDEDLYKGPYTGAKVQNKLYDLGFFNRGSGVEYNSEGAKGDASTECAQFFVLSGNIDMRLSIHSSNPAFDQKLKTLFSYILPDSGNKLYSIIDNPNAKSQTLTMDGRRIEIEVYGDGIIIDFGPKIK
ncbi:cell wall binding repeat-containing protein [Clostridium sporogenes]|uniref:cell wall-binding repeat-containing protein n=1 Tax=Clostridium botulinum TaxID=1491 RepID=UPI0007176105|nr:cell wall-binding repeat-containing protein [Clostridium botulinum]KRU26801.1 cell wall binding repeat-containing protein [Clostridium sporogenes]KRU29665.1 cell wall binding repeat-containing protein [Clostridium sporogenes]KRU35430.1 cell wall binding repeat-containing protein [Clostridium sporogenes]KRU49655.1 cell wall binding repeat-containing protein [Clostridium sporogenes]MBZ1328448.1 cell wall-binding repeat-containing protein [Clostridium botulinum]